MADIGWAARIRPGVEAWRALEPQTRRAVRQAARRRVSAPDAGTASAAVAYGRWLRRRWYTIACVLGALALGLTAAAGLLDQPGQADAAVALVVLAGVAGVGMLGAFARAGRGAGRLIGANLGLAAERLNGVASPRWRVGLRQSRLVFTLYLIGLPVVAAVGLWWRQVGPALLALVVFVGHVRGGPAWGGTIYAASMDASGVDLPTWRARIPWTSVGAVTIGEQNQLCIAVNGPFEPSGSLPRWWARRVGTALQPGKTIKITVAYPELGLWTARYHLDGNRAVAGTAP